MHVLERMYFSEFSFLHGFSKLMYFLSFRLAENMALILEMVASQYHVLLYVFGCDKHPKSIKV